MERTPALTFVIPVGVYHREIAERAIQSVLDQTIVCNAVVVYDNDSRGAGWARNRGLEQVETPFISFIDADDWLEPTFAEELLRHYDGQHYSYSDWWKEDAEVVEAPEQAWINGAWHIITTLLPTVFVKRVGGFDESLPAGEDTDLYMKLGRAGLCGRRLPRALFHYSKDGLRSKAIIGTPAQSELVATLNARYGATPMACCGEYVPMEGNPANQPQEGDVLAQALWGGNRQERGRVSGRLYPRTGNGRVLFVHPADIDAAPHLFARVVELPPKLDEAALAQFRAVARQVMRTVDAPPTLPDSPLMPVPAGTPEVARVLRLYAGTREANSPGG